MWGISKVKYLIKDSTEYSFTHNIITEVCGNFFFRGGGEPPFSKWSISSHIRVQITRESVRLIALIGLNMFLIHNISRKCLKKFSRTGFWWSVLRNWLKMAFFGCFKAFISNFLYYNLYWRKLWVITWPQCALRFFMRPLDFSLGNFEYSSIFMAI